MELHIKYICKFRDNKAEPDEVAKSMKPSKRIITRHTFIDQNEKSFHRLILMTSGKPWLANTNMRFVPSTHSFLC